MSEQTWTPESMAAFAAIYGLSSLTPEHVARMAELGNKVVKAAAAIPRMPSKGDEPASIFKVPL
jgi:hypothetical protein